MFFSKYKINWHSTAINNMLGNTYDGCFLSASNVSCPRLMEELIAGETKSITQYIYSIKIGA